MSSRMDIEKLTAGQDFNLWRLKMRAWLIHQGLIDAISEEGLEVLGRLDGNRSREIKRKAYSSLLLCLGDEVLREVAELETAIEIWGKLESLFLRRSVANRLILKKRLYTFTMEEGQDMKKQLDVFNKLVLDLRSLDVKVEEEDQAIILLSSLPKSYENIVDTMLYGREALNMEDVKGMLCSKELQRQSSSLGEKAASGEVLLAKGRGGSKGKGDQKCFFCKKEGHFKRDCHKWKAWTRKNGDGEASVGEAVDGDSFGDVLVASGSRGGDEWVLDSGCSFHMSPRRAWFQNFRKLGGEVLHAGGESCPVRGIGDVHLKMFNDRIRILSAVRYVPNLDRNLISLGTLDKRGLKVSLKDGWCRVSSRSEICMKGKLTGTGIYLMEGHTASREACSRARPWHDQKTIAGFNSIGRKGLG